MAYDFPNSPTNGQQYTPAGGSTYTYVLADNKWTVTGTGITGLATASQADVLAGASTSAAVTPNAMVVLWAKGASLASAATLVIPAGGLFHVTGTTTISDIDFQTSSADGRWVWLIFEGTLSIVHTVNLALPGGQTITTAVGDRALFVQDAGEAVICMHYQRAGTFPSISGTYTPGTATGLNVAAMTPFICNYYRAGNVVAVSGRVDIDPVAVDTATVGYMGVPIPLLTTNFSGGAQASGVFACQSSKGQSGGILAAPGTANVQFSYVPGVATNEAFQFHFTYQV